jgi:predicted nucleotidyltransferase
MTDFPSLLRALGAAGVEFIVVGGAAATAHGSARLTLDLDVVYRRTPENMARSETFTLFGIACRCLSLERLIQVKRATGRVKDLEALAELEAIAEERRR